MKRGGEREKERETTTIGTVTPLVDQLDLSRIFLLVPIFRGLNSCLGQETRLICLIGFYFRTKMAEWLYTGWLVTQAFILNGFLRFYFYIFLLSEQKFRLFLSQVKFFLGFRLIEDLSF